MTEDAPLPAAADIVRLFETFAPLYRRHVCRPLPRGVGTAQRISLAALVRRGPMSMSDLLGHLGGTAQNATGIGNMLEAEGRARRLRDGSDGRKVMIELADETRADVLAQREAHRHEVARLLHALDSNERAAFADMLGRLIDAMQAAERQAD